MLPKCIEFHLMQYLLGLKIKHLKALEDNCLSKQLKWRESNFEKYDNFVFWWLFFKTWSKHYLMWQPDKRETYAKELLYSNFHDSPRWLYQWSKG